MKKIMAANWKMYKTQQEAKDTAKKLLELIDGKVKEDREVLICPPFTSLSVVADVINRYQYMKLGAQNFYPAIEGAYTGEISPKMLIDVGCEYALVGHSERRHILNESPEFLAQKVEFGLEMGLKIIYCIGEKLDQRKAGKVEQVLTDQLEKGLAKVSKEKDIVSRLAIAYEPVWAIGTGEVAGEKEIYEAHTLVREKLIEFIGGQAKDIPILYGGSVKPDNVKSIINIDNVDGVLVGGASLDANSFSQIVLA